MARRHAMLAAAAAAVSVLGLGTTTAVHAAMGPPPAGPPHVTVYPVVLRLQEPDPGYRGVGVSACVQELERTQGPAGSGVPRLVVVGASFTAGTGSGPRRSWAVLLARYLRWDAVVYGVPGAGYVRAGARHEGPVAAELARVDLPGLKPSLVVVQAGHDDIGVPQEVEAQRVERAIAVIRAEAPRARIVLLTVFTRRSPTAAARATDRTIVGAARAADPAVIIIDPLAAGWRFPRARDGLHPTPAGSAWIAGQVTAILHEHGVRPAPERARGGRSVVICDWA